MPYTWPLARLSPMTLIWTPRFEPGTTVPVPVPRSRDSRSLVPSGRGDTTYTLDWQFGGRAAAVMAAARGSSGRGSVGRRGGAGCAGTLGAPAGGLLVSGAVAAVPAAVGDWVADRVGDGEALAERPEGARVAARAGAGAAGAAGAGEADEGAGIPTMITNASAARAAAARPVRVAQPTGPIRVTRPSQKRRPVRTPRSSATLVPIPGFYEESRQIPQDGRRADRWRTSGHRLLPRWPGTSHSSWLRVAIREAPGAGRKLSPTPGEVPWRS